MSENRKRGKSLSSNTSHGRSSEANDSTSLLNASALGNTEKVKLLLAKDVDVNTTRNDGATPLALAVQGGHTETVDKLLQHPNIEINKKFGDYTPFDFAAQNGYTEIVRKLLQHKDMQIEKDDHSHICNRLCRARERRREEVSQKTPAVQSQDRQNGSHCLQNCSNISGIIRTHNWMVSGDGPSLDTNAMTPRWTLPEYDMTYKDWGGEEDAVNLNAKEHAGKIQRENAGKRQKENAGEDAERIQKKPVKIFHKDPNAFITLNIFNKMRINHFSFFVF